jgi:hypothetical protein
MSTSGHHLHVAAPPPSAALLGRRQPVEARRRPPHGVVARRPPGIAPDQPPRRQQRAPPHAVLFVGVYRVGGAGGGEAAGGREQRGDGRLVEAQQAQRNPAAGISVKPANSSIVHTERIRTLRLAPHARALLLLARQLGGAARLGLLPPRAAGGAWVAARPWRQAARHPGFHRLSPCYEDACVALVAGPHPRGGMACGCHPCKGMLQARQSLHDSLHDAAT